MTFITKVLVNFHPEKTHRQSTKTHGQTERQIRVTLLPHVDGNNFLKTNMMPVISRKAQYKAIYRRTIEVSQRAHILRLIAV